MRGNSKQKRGREREDERQVKREGEKKELEGGGKENGEAKKNWRRVNTGGEKTWEEGIEQKQGVEMTMNMEQGRWKRKHVRGEERR